MVGGVFHFLLFLLLLILLSPLFLLADYNQQETIYFSTSSSILCHIRQEVIWELVVP